MCARRGWQGYVRGEEGEKVERSRKRKRERHNARKIFIGRELIIRPSDPSPLQRGEKKREREEFPTGQANRVM
jgi:hypothetical protein